MKAQIDLLKEIALKQGVPENIVAEIISNSNTAD